MSERRRLRSSGLAVQNPDGPSANPLPENDAGSIIGNIMKQASEYV